MPELITAETPGTPCAQNSARQKSEYYPSRRRAPPWTYSRPIMLSLSRALQKNAKSAIVIARPNIWIRLATSRSATSAYGDYDGSTNPFAGLQAKDRRASRLKAQGDVAPQSGDRKTRRMSRLRSSKANMMAFDEACA